MSKKSRKRLDELGFFMDDEGHTRQVPLGNLLGREHHIGWFKTMMIVFAVLVLAAGVVAGAGWYWAGEQEGQIKTSQLNADADVGQSVMVPYDPSSNNPVSTSETPSSTESSPSTSESSSPSESSTPSGSTTTTPPTTSSVTPSKAQEVAIDDGVENILVMGTDTRAGTKSGIGGDESGSGRADVMILIHIPSDRSAATAVSIPRDTVAYIPSCHKADGSGVSPAVPMGQINSSLESGPGCTVATVERMSKVKITHFAVINFDAAISLSNAVGGVEVNLAAPINDDKTGLNLTAGKHTLKGKDALAYVRSRYGVGDGSDLGRIKNQHQFLMSLTHKLLSSGTLSNPQKFTSIADTITKNLTVDDGLDSIDKLMTLGNSLSKLDPNTVKFVTLPVEYWSENRSRVVPIQGAAEQMWSKLR